MFKNEFVLSGFCKRIGEMKNKDDGQFQGLYISLATIGESYGVYVAKDCPGIQAVKQDAFLEVRGNLKTKATVNHDGGARSITSLTVTSIIPAENPMTGKK